MAKNEPNRPDDVKTTSVNKASAEEQTAPDTIPPEIAGDTPAPEMTAEEAATLAHEGEVALQEMGEAEIEPPTPFDIGGKHIIASKNTSKNRQLLRSFFIRHRSRFFSNRCLFVCWIFGRAFVQLRAKLARSAVLPRLSFAALLHSIRKPLTLKIEWRNYHDNH